MATAIMWGWLKALCDWFVKLLGGFLPIGTKPIGEWLGKILWAVGIFMLCQIAIRGCNKSKVQQTQTTTIQNPANVQIDQRQTIEGRDNDIMFLGVRLWRIKLGLSYLQRQYQERSTGLEAQEKKEPVSILPVKVKSGT